MKKTTFITISRQFFVGSLFSVGTILLSCNAPNKPETLAGDASEQAAIPEEAEEMVLFGANKVTELDRNIRSVFQDKKGNYWFGTNSSGVYRYDGKTLFQFTEKDGLFSNQVQAIREDQDGNIWFSTGGFGVSRFDGRAFTTFTTKSDSKASWKTEPNDLWFYAGGGVYRYNGRSLSYLPLAATVAESRDSKNPADRLSIYTVYCCLKDRNGNSWFGTQGKGVCKYDGTSFTWFKEKGLEGPAVLGLFEDRTGNLWFGTNGSGLFRYDPMTDKLTNFTDEKGLGNPAFRTTGKSGPGTLARIYAINEDKNGILWIGTIDAGVWRYDGSKLTNYTTKNGLTSNAVNTIYKDKNGELWFGTDADGLCKFNGVSFTEFAVLSH